MLKRIWEKIIFEIRMSRMDAKWHNRLHCWEMYPPSFYYRYTPEQQKEIIDRDIAKIRAMLEEFEEQTDRTKT